MNMLQKGFTLIELMIVIAIIGILAAIAVPQYQNYIIRSQVAEGITMASEMKIAISDFYATKGRHSSNFASIGLSPAASYTGNYVTSLATNTSGTITITYNQAKANAKIRGLTLGFSPYVNPAGQLVWVCGTGLATGLTMSLTNAGAVGTAFTGNMPNRYKPSDCKA